MRTWVTRGVVTAIVAVASLTAPATLVPGSGAPAAASAAMPTAVSADATPIGYDISYPQCTKSSAVNKVAHAFGIVGVNGGRAIGFNPCFADEVVWAGVTDSAASEQTPLSFYLNTGNPSVHSPYWPTSNTTAAGTIVKNPHGTCLGKAGSACAYIYGYSVAEADFAHVQEVMSGVNIADRTWWLDVETTNSWQLDTSANSADLSGMVDYLKSQAAKVGIYGTSYQWRIIAGVTSPSSHLSGLQSWLAGASSSSAASDCSRAALTPRGRVSLVQYVSANLDHDLSCHVFTAPAPTIIGTATVGKKLTAVPGSWTGSPRLSFQWFRDGSKIKGATSSTHTTTAHDVDKTITVRVGGSRAGYNPKSVTSAGLTINRALASTPVPTVSGTFSVGQLLTAHAGTWHPQPVDLTYQWNRNGVAIVGATAKTYTLVEADSATTITVSVTGSEHGYNPVTKTGSGHVIAAE